MKYKCNDCGHEAEGNDFTTECESCDNSNIQILKSRVKLPWRIILSAVGIIIMFSVVLRKCNKTNRLEGQEKLAPTDVTIKLGDNGVDWFFYATYTSVDGKIKLDPSQVKEIRYKKHKMSFNSTTGQLYPCLKDSVATKYDFHFKNPVYNSASSNKIALANNKAYPKANCPLIITWEDLNVNIISDCRYEISLTTRGERIDLKKLKISLTGINGPYLSNFIWSPTNEGLKKKDIFIIYNSDADTLKNCPYNGQSYNPCSICTAEQIESRKVLITEAAKAYLGQPTDREKSRPFRDLLMKISIREISVNGKSYDWADLSAIVQEGDSKTPKVKYQLEKVEITNNCNHVLLRVITK
tara:strand:- start:8851 stop:9912 length:1062 start_codon:yes stop_codon:yes gene_type:complete